jgi:WD40 repeat protein
MSRTALTAGLAVLWSALGFATDLPIHPPKFDAYGHPLPDAAVARLGDIGLRSVRIRSFTFSPDGRFVARLRESGIDIRELATGRDVTPAYLYGLSEAELVFTADGRHVVLETGRGRCRIIDPATGEVRNDLTIEGRHPWFAAVSANGRTACVRWYDGRGGSAVTLFDLTSSAKPTGRDLLQGQQGHCCLSADGSLLLAATEGGTRVFDTATGKELTGHGLPSPAHAIAIALSHDGKTLATLHVDHLRLYPLTSAGVREPILLPPVELRGGMVWSADGRELLVSCRGEIVRIDGAAGRFAGVVRRPDGLGSRGAAYLSPDGHLAASASGPGAPTVWDVRTGRTVYRYPDRPPLFRVACPDNRTVTTLAAGSRIELWNRADGRSLTAQEFAGPNRPVWAAGNLSADGRFLAVYDDASRAVQVYDTASGRLLRAGQDWANAFPSGIGFSPSGERLVVAAQGQVTLADRESGRAIRQLPNGGLAASFSPDGRLVAVLDKDEVRLVEVFTNRVRRTLPIAAIPIDAADVRFPAGRVRFSRDGSRLAVFGPCYRVWVWSVSDGELLYEDRGDRSALFSDVWPGAIGPDGRWLAYPAEDGAGVRVFDLTNPRPGSGTTTLRGHRGRIADMTFTPDGRRLVSVCADGIGLVWDVAAVAAKLGPRTPEPVSSEALWTALADTSAEVAGRAVEGFLRQPGAAKFLGDRLEPVASPDPAPIRSAIAALDSDSFAARDRAEQLLRGYRELAAPALEAATQDAASPELRDRLQRLLAQANGLEHAPDRLRTFRAVEVLERLGTADARQVLQRLAGGVPHARLTREAKAALERTRPAHGE